MKSLLRKLDGEGFYEILLTENRIWIRKLKNLHKAYLSSYIANICLDDKRAIRSFIRKLITFRRFIGYISREPNLLKVRGSFK